MKTISLWEPWATYIALGHKAIETRGYATRVRGTIAIHAAKRFVALCPEMITQYDIPVLKKSDCASGAIVAVAELVDCLQLLGGATQGYYRGPSGAVCKTSTKEYWLGDFAPGRFGWMLQNVRKLKTPIPWKGKQGWFDVPDQLVKEQL